MFSFGSNVIYSLTNSTDKPILYIAVYRRKTGLGTNNNPATRCTQVFIVSNKETRQIPKPTISISRFEFFYLVASINEGDLKDDINASEFNALATQNLSILANVYAVNNKYNNGIEII